MARLMYWSLYKLDLGPLGPLTFKLAPRLWLASSRRRASFKPLIKRGPGFPGMPQSIRTPEARV
jgi:hypothetical protein